MKATLSSGKEFQIKSLTLGQVKRMVATTKAGHGMEATSQACADSTGLTVEQIDEQLTILEANELLKQVLDLSGLGMGETTAAK